MPEPKRTALGTILGIVVGVVTTTAAWSYAAGSRITAIESKQGELERRVIQAEAERDEVRRIMQSIDQRLSRMEGKLDRATR